MTEATQAQIAVIGEVINDKYRLLAPVGRGGMGVVYRAEQLTLSRPVALKVLRTDRDFDRADPGFRDRFVREASLCARLSHPNVVTVYDFGTIESPSAPALAGGFFLAMEFLSGETLHQRLHQVRVLPLVDTLRIVAEIARGLRAAHRQGLVHRDLKPANIMLIEHPDEGGEQVKIFDFGLVKRVESDEMQELTQEGALLGSPRYIAPEQVSRGPVDHRTDLYALGIIFYQCLCGRTPFDGTTATDVMLARLTNLPPPLRERNPDCIVPAAVEDVVMKLLARDPADRYASAQEFLLALRGIREAVGLTGTFAATGEMPAADPALAASVIPPAPMSASGPRPVPLLPLPPVPSFAPAPLPLQEAPEVREADPPPRSRRFGARTLAVLLVVFATVFAATILALVRVRPAREVEPVRVSREGRAPDVPARGTFRTEAVAIVQAPVLAPPMSAPPPSPPPPVVREAPDASVALTGHRRRPSESPPGPPVVRIARVTQDVPPVTATPAPAEAPTPPEDGYLSIDTSPWTNVILSGRPLGSTPLVRVRLPPGSHALTLRNPELGVNETVTVTVRAGETTALRRDLNSP